MKKAQIKFTKTQTWLIVIFCIGLVQVPLFSFNASRSTFFNPGADVAILRGDPSLRATTSNLTFEECKARSRAFFKDTVLFIFFLRANLYNIDDRIRVMKDYWEPWFPSIRFIAPLKAPNATMAEIHHACDM